MRQSAKAAERKADHVDRMGELRPLVFARAGWVCEARGVLPGRCESFLNAHHRLTRGNGGPDTLENLMALCGSGTTGHHGYVHAHPQIGYDLGFLIRKADGPPTEPWQRLDDGTPRV